MHLTMICRLSTEKWEVKDRCKRCSCTLSRRIKVKRKAGPSGSSKMRPNPYSSKQNPCYPWHYRRESAGPERILSLSALLKPWNHEHKRITRIVDRASPEVPVFQHPIATVYGIYPWYPVHIFTYMHRIITDTTPNDPIPPSIGGMSPKALPSVIRRGCLILSTMKARVEPLR